MEVVGKIIQVLPAQEGVGRNGNPWRVQPYVLETLDQYPRKVHFEVFGEDRIKQNPCEMDQLVTVSFDIESREFNGRWYTSIRAWKIQQGDTTQVAAPAPAKQTEPKPIIKKIVKTAQLPPSKPAVKKEPTTKVAKETKAAKATSAKIEVAVKRRATGK